MRQRFMTIAVDQQRTADGAAYIPTILFDVDVPLVTIYSVPRQTSARCTLPLPGVARVVEQRTKLGDRNRDVRLEGIPPKKS